MRLTPEANGCAANESLIKICLLGYEMFCLPLRHHRRAITRQKLWVIRTLVVFVSLCLQKNIYMTMSKTQPRTGVPAPTDPDVISLLKGSAQDTE